MISPSSIGRTRTWATVRYWPAFLKGLGMPGNANLPIGDLQYANLEIGVPRFQTMQCVPSVHRDWEAIYVESPRKDGLSGRGPAPSW